MGDSKKVGCTRDVFEFPFISSDGKEKVERYYKCCVLGKGAFGEVFLGAKEMYAIKHMKLNIGISKLPGVQKEIKILQKASKDCKVTPAIRDYYISNDEAVLVMDYVDGVPLDEIDISPDSKEGIEKWKDIFYLLILGLECLHRNDIIHVDIKPENIMVTPEYNIYYLDFGVSCIGLPCQMGGTPSFMPPEFRIVNLKTLDGNKMESDRANYLSDVFMLGATIYEMMAEKPLMDPNQDKDEIFFANVEEGTEYYEEVISEAREELETLTQFRPWNVIVSRMLSFERLDRPSVFDILQALKTNDMSYLDNTRTRNKKYVFLQGNRDDHKEIEKQKQIKYDQKTFDNYEYQFEKDVYLKLIKGDVPLKDLYQELYLGYLKVEKYGDGDENNVLEEDNYDDAKEYTEIFFKMLGTKESRWKNYPTAEWRKKINSESIYWADSD